MQSEKFIKMASLKKNSCQQYLEQLEKLDLSKQGMQTPELTYNHLAVCQSCVKATEVKFIARLREINPKLQNVPHEVLVEFLNLISSDGFFNNSGGKNAV